ncbi:hypothetical protein B0H11DRAFT_1281584 [Mycena galericulata]|nr:hypothetical protein B0H11DRAFT_1281584 [Mycena galericulata]
MASDDSLTPKIPPELERYIFELCALADRSGIPSLLRVAHRVHVWIEPLLYHALVLDYSQPCRLTPADSRDAAFLASHVKHLNLTGPMPHDQLCALLAACTGTTNLALWVPTPLPDLLPFLQALTLTRLSADTTHLFGGPLRVNFAHPALRALTHLDILAAGFDDWRLSAGLATGLPHLTHLAFRDKFHPHVLRGALAHCKALRALGVVWSARRRAVDVREGEVVDARLFVTVCAEWAGDWAAGARGGDDVWARGEVFIARKAAGQIPLSRLWVK